MAFNTPYTFGFAAAICVTCSLAVAVAAQGLRDLQQTNARRDVQGSILSALGESGHTGEAIDEAFETMVSVTFVDGSGDPVDATQEAALAFEATDLYTRLGETGGLEESEWETFRSEAILRVYALERNGTVESYAIPMSGVGLWGPISGYLALEPDAETVRGVTFFAPKETPGLGYEIVNEPFTSLWTGKKIYDGGELAPIDVVKGDVDLACAGRTEHCVKGVSGATMTSDGVDAMVQAALAAYQPYLDQLRSGGNG